MRKAAEVRKDIKAKLRELRKTIKDIRILQNELRRCPRLQYYSYENNKLLGSSGSDDILYNTGWEDGHRAAYNKLTGSVS